MSTTKFATLLLISAITTASYADGVITASSGRVEILKNASSKPIKDTNTVLLDGTYYKIEKARIGTKVINGTVVRTGPDGKARVVFPNGDHIVVSPASSVGIDWKNTKNENEENGTALTVAYGKLRAMVSKDGPRKGTQVKTPAAVAGVRGTDFFVSYSPAKETSEVSVLRGEVEVKNNKTDKPVSVSSGHKVEVVEPSRHPAKETPKMEVRLATKTELMEIHKSTIVTTETKSQEMAPEIAKLEQKAQANVIEEIKTYDPKMYEQIKNENLKSTQEIGAVVVATLYKAAPEAPKKPSLKELESLEGDDVYDKYFK